jgi:putative PIN family toxin of toxin-antitoxin system
MMKILIDTNVWISGLLWGGKARDVINLARQNKIIIYVSSLLLNELEETLSYPKLQRRLRQLGVTRVELMEEVKNLTLLCQPTPLLSISELRDPKDKIVLETALTIPVDVIISGDKDLLILQEFQKIPILTIAQFLEFYEE